MSSFEVDYEEDLVPRIRDLIDSYGKDSILKEYLQNADDSSATELIVTFDKSKYPELDNTIFKSANSNALLLSNNSQFKEKDFKSIVKISAQGKTDDANSTGRFGQGFSSSFSISDHPSFVSNGRAYWFDILRSAVSKNKQKSIQGWEYEKSNEIEEWLSTFNTAGLNRNFKGTIFRLPLRDSITSINSKISNEIFTFSDFLKWVDDWKESSENLLFLRHIHKLVLQEIDENGQQIIHLEIKTKNYNEIENVNNTIQKEFDNSDNLLNICKDWEKNATPLPLFNYQHIFEVKYFERETHSYKTENKIYAVVNGLFRGKNNILIEYAKKVLNITPNPRKVLPWAGVAVEINKEGKPIGTKSKLFTFLPLPIESKYPIHIHGWFDLNPKRTEITSVGSEYDKETLIKWNKLLLQEGVGRAWAMLTESLKKYNNAHYPFWAKSTEFDLDENIINGFYQYIATLHCFFIQFKNKSGWISPKKTKLYYTNSKNDILLNAFKEHFPIVKIKPPKYIIDNFKEISIELVELTPEYVREYLEEKSKALEFPVALEAISIVMLQKKEWLIEIIKYCADNGEDYSLIDGLPLELTLDGKIYKVGVNTFFDENPSLSLFQGKKHLFIDIDIVKSIGENVENLPSSWIMPTLENKIILINSYIEEKEMSKEWILEVVDLIIFSKEDEFIEAKDEIEHLKIVYQEDETFTTLSSNIEDFSPFIPRDEDRKSNLNFYSEIQMNLVHYDYIDIYAKLLKFKGLITQLTSKSMIDHLLALDEHSFLLKNDIREFVIQIISDNISWFSVLDESQKFKLSTIPFIKTVQDNIYSQDTSVTLFLPTNFEPLEHIESLKGEYELVAVKADTNLYSLYEKMGIEEQNISNYMENIIIPFLKNSDDKLSRKMVLKWLSEKWRDIKHELNDDIKDELKSSKIIPTAQDESVLLGIDEIYLPDVILPDVLDDNPYKTINFMNKEVQEDWIDLLDELGANNHVMSKHILYKVETIVEKNDKDKAIKLANYIANNFEVFEPMLYKEKHILEVLKDYAWLPVEYPKDIFKPKDPYKKLQKPTELILRDDAKLVGGYYFVLDSTVKLGKKDESVEYSARDMAKLLGITVSLPIESVFESFRELMKLNPSNGQVLNYAKTFYKYIGRIYPDRIDFDSDEATILIDGQWISPKYVYQQKINLTGTYNWSELVGDLEKETNLSKGLILLGVREKPEFDFLIEQLESIPLDILLDKKQLNDAKALLKEIRNDDENLFSQFNELPLLTTDNKLILSSKLFINDLDDYNKAENKNNDILFCHDSYRSLARGLGVRSLVDSYESKIDYYEECESQYDIDKILKRDSFKEAILRLLFHDKVIKEEEINDDILQSVFPSKIIFVNKLVIKYFIDELFLYKSEETTYNEDRTLYILDQEDEEDMIELIAKYISEPKNTNSNRELTKDSFGYIGRILREKMSHEKIKDFLDKKKIVPLPREFNIDDEPDLYGNVDKSYMESDEVTVDMDVVSEEEFEEEAYTPAGESQGIEIQSSYHSSIQPTMTSSENKEEDESSNTEIAPPTKPRSSSESVEANTSRSNKPIQKNSDRSSGFNQQATPTKTTTQRKTNTPFSDTKHAHVYKRKEHENDQYITKNSFKKEIGEKGEDYIIEHQEKYILSPKNSLTKAPINNKGFDIFETDSNGNVVRYIEVKSKLSEWGDGGVAITNNQYEFAQKEKDKWWLFVVEHVDTEYTKVYRLPNPVLEVNRYVFDGSWKLLSLEQSSVTKIEPNIGDRYIVNLDDEERELKIINVKKRGALYKVELLAASGQKYKKKFDKNWRKL